MEQWVQTFIFNDSINDWKQARISVQLYRDYKT